MQAGQARCKRGRASALASRPNRTHAPTLLHSLTSLSPPLTHTTLSIFQSPALLLYHSFYRLEALFYLHSFHSLSKTLCLRLVNATTSLLKLLASSAIP